MSHGHHWLWRFSGSRRHGSATKRLFCRFVEAVVWILRAGAPRRDLPDVLGHWPSVCHCFRRWCVRGWWDLVFEHPRPALPAGGQVLADDTTCKTHQGWFAAQVAWRDGLQDPPLHRRERPDPAAHRQPRAPPGLAPCPGADGGYPGHGCGARLRLGLGGTLRRSRRTWLHRSHPAQAGNAQPAAVGQGSLPQRHRIENLFSRLKEQAGTALHRDKTRRS